MNEKMKFDTYKWFISAYFNISYRWNELEGSINDFFEREEPKEIKNLLMEAKLIKDMDDWEYLRTLNIETAEIYYEETRNREFIQKIIDVLSDKLSR